MAISSTRAQDAIGCLLCDMPSQQFCNNCQINLCVDCISIHVDTSKSVSHDIVHLKNKTTRLKYHKALKVTSECAKTDSETEKLRDIWHQEVDAIFNKVGSVAQFFKDYKLAALTTEQSKIKKLVQDSIHTVRKTNSC
uniref:B box-type domain-containing protein n=1 Tax=Magallana gigas TaxID=29159 RepID=A0A8W8LNR4_MAGGI